MSFSSRSSPFVDTCCVCVLPADISHNDAFYHCLMQYHLRIVWRRCWHLQSPTMSWNCVLSKKNEK